MMKVSPVDESREGSVAINVGDKKFYFTKQVRIVRVKAKLRNKSQSL